MNKIFSTLLLVLFSYSQALMAAAPLNLNGSETNGVNGTGHIVFLPNPSPQPPTINAYALNDEVTVDTSKTMEATGNAAANDVVTVDGNPQPISLSLLWNTPAASPYGFLNFSSDGTFKYTLYEKSLEILKLQAGKNLEDVFEYEVQGYPQAKAVIRVHIVGNPIPVTAVNDEASVDSVDGTTVSGNVLANDQDFMPGSAALVSSPSSIYGHLAFSSSGDFTYTIFANTPAVQALQPGDVKTDVFTYSVKSLNGFNTATATLTIRIAGNVITSVMAIDDTATVIIDSSVQNPSVTVNILENDVNAGSASLIGSPVGKYGYIDGAISGGELKYRVNMSNPDVQNTLKNGQPLMDSFKYKVNGTETNQAKFAEGNIYIYIVAGNVTGFRAYDFVDTIVAEEVVTGTGNTTTVTPPGTVKGNLITYNNGLLNIENLVNRAELISSQYGAYGFLKFAGNGEFEYTLNNNVPEVQALRNSNNALQDNFDYRITDRYGNTAEAKIVINIVSRREQVTTDNVEIESNNKSSLATPLTSGNYMRGNLMNSSDRDWFYITSNGNEVLQIELCPQGFNCYNQKAWVLYVFDGDLLTQQMQDTTIPLNLTRDDTGAILNTRTSDHLYLLYNSRVFGDALVGVIDPCYGNKNSVNVGAPTLAPGKTKNYFIAISSPLQRSGSSTGTGSTDSTCSGGSIILKEPGPSFDEASGATTKKVTTTQEFIAVFPNSDDQYSFKLTRTGTSPINTRSKAESATYNGTTGAVTIPKVRIGDSVFSANLQQTKTGRSAGNTYKFAVTGFNQLNEQVSPNPTLGVYNPANNIVKLPSVIFDQTGESFSVDLRYNPNNTLDLLSIKPN